MSIVRIALANVRFPSSREESVMIVLDAIESASKVGAAIVCFPECMVPGYRVGTTNLAPESQWLERVWTEIDAKAGQMGIWVILGTERRDADGARIVARVTNANGKLEGFQDKVQLDPSEESTYMPGVSRRLFEMGNLTFGVVICHEGWRYPETVRWAAQKGAQVVFHPHAELPGSTEGFPKQFIDPANSFHEKSALCRAAENTCYFATVNFALPGGSSTTSAVIDPEGRPLAWQPYGEDGLLVCEIDTDKATGYLAKRFRQQSVIVD